MWLYLFGQSDESLRALRGREAPCGIRSTPGSSPRSSGGRWSRWRAPASPAPRRCASTASASPRSTAGSAASTRAAPPPPRTTGRPYLDDFSMIENWMNAIMGSVYGVCLFLFLFGILNMVNMLITSMIVRKQEFALLQAVGMSGKQLRSMLYQEGLGISLKSLLVSVILGVVCGYGLSYLGRDILSFKFISFHFSVFPVLLFGLLMIGLQMAISYSICKTIEKKTLTERLRSE